VIEELISAGMIEEDRHQVLGTTAFRQVQSTKPRFDLNSLHIPEFVLAPLWNNPTAQIDRIAILGGVASPSVGTRQSANVAEANRNPSANFAEI
jgi:hypothetical protein